VDQNQGQKFKGTGETARSAIARQCSIPIEKIRQVARRVDYERQIKSTKQVVPPTAFDTIEVRMDWQYLVLTSGRSDAEVAGFVTDLTREYMDEVAEESC
jgi:hypothetical protein